MQKEQNNNIINDTKKDVELFKNILIIFADSLSRQHMMRKLPKLFSWFENNYNNTDSEYSSYQFLKYQSLFPGTVANIASAFYGTFPGKKGYSILKLLKDKGYITGVAQNFCQRTSFEIEDFKYNFTFENPDHEFWSLFCDPSYLDIKNPFQLFKGPYSMTKKCVWGKDSIYWTTEYVKHFFHGYSSGLASDYTLVSNLPAFHCHQFSSVSNFLSC